jgi:hypothetical protein
MRNPLHPTFYSFARLVYRDVIEFLPFRFLFHAFLKTCVLLSRPILCGSLLNTHGQNCSPQEYLYQHLSALQHSSHLLSITSISSFTIRSTKNYIITTHMHIHSDSETKNSETVLLLKGVSPSPTTHKLLYLLSHHSSSCVFRQAFIILLLGRIILLRTISLFRMNLTTGRNATMFFLNYTCSTINCPQVMCDA